MAEVSPARLVPLFRRELEMCKVHSGETIAILTKNKERLHYVQAFEVAAQELGAAVFHIDIPSPLMMPLEGIALPTLEGLSSNPIVVEALKKADLVIDSYHMLWSKEQRDILSAGTRVLLAYEPIDVITRLFPTVDQRRRVEESAGLIKPARTMRITNPTGTDLLYEIGQYGLLVQYGYTDQPGRWDHFASSLIATVGNDFGVNGTMVLNPGDILLPFKRYVEDPVRFTIRRGRIEKIEGNYDAELIRSYMASFDDDQAYGCSHIGWGLNENARWDAIALGAGGVGMDARSCYGSIMFATGPNSELGGDNHTPAHIDIPTRGSSLFLDDEMIINQGQIVKNSLRV